MEATKRERIIELGAKITSWRLESDEIKTKIAEAESEIDRLVTITPRVSVSSGTITAILTEGMVVPPLRGTLSDQVLAVLNANPKQSLAPEIITTLLNKMADRLEPARQESVLAALSRLVADGSIARLERGRYQAKEGADTSRPQL